MEINIKGAPSFSYLEVHLGPGEAIMTESGAMSSMDAGLDLKAGLNGSIFMALVKKFLGGESLFINEFKNNTAESRKLHLTQGFPGDVILRQIHEGETLYLQPGAYICSEKGIKLGLEWAGINSFIGGEGLFRLKITGNGQVVFGGYGGLVEREVDGEVIVDTSHLVAYPKGFQIKTQLSGGLISSFTSGEGFVMRVRGKGKIILQTRSVSGLVKWVNRQI
jgi:uncharacterized protein (TIGR00266 family)